MPRCRTWPARACSTPAAAPACWRQSWPPRGAHVTAVDISPRLVAMARAASAGEDAWQTGSTGGSGDLTDPALGSFDHVVAMDSLIYYGAADLARIVGGAAPAGGVGAASPCRRAPRCLPRCGGWGGCSRARDRSPLMVPQSAASLAAAGAAGAPSVARVARGFYISTPGRWRSGR